MRLWKPMLFIMPAGLVLGMIGGYWAKPVLTQRVSDEPWQAMFQTRADRYGTDTGYPTQADDSVPYDGGYSYPPSWALQTNVNWTPQARDNVAYVDSPLPTIAELDARQSSLLADPEREFAVQRTGQDPPVAEEATPAETTQPETVALANDTADTTPEPQAADGQRAMY